MKTSDFKDIGFFFMNSNTTIFLSHEEIVSFDRFIKQKGYKRFDKEFDHLSVKQSLPFQELVRIFKYIDNYSFPIKCYNEQLFPFLNSTKEEVFSSVSAAAFARCLELQEVPFKKIKTENKYDLVDLKYFKPKGDKDVVISDKKVSKHTTVNPILFKDWVSLLKKAKSFKTLDPILLNLKECFTLE